MLPCGTERGYELGYPKDSSIFQAKVLTSGRYDPDWIRDPKDRNDPKERSSIMGQVIIPYILS